MRAPTTPSCGLCQLRNGLLHLPLSLQPLPRGRSLSTLIERALRSHAARCIQATGVVQIGRRTSWRDVQSDSVTSPGWEYERLRSYTVSLFNEACKMAVI